MMTPATTTRNTRENEMAKVSAEQINAAMDAMAAQGQAITVRALRETLGNGACLGTVSKLLQRRKAGAQRQIAAAATLSPVLQQAILDFVGQELSASHTAHEAEMNDNQQELMDLASENERQQELLDVQAGELETLRAELERERQVANQARTDLAKAQLRLEGLPRLEEAAEQARWTWPRHNSSSKAFRAWKRRPRRRVPNWYRHSCNWKP